LIDPDGLIVDVVTIQCRAVIRRDVVARVGIGAALVGDVEVVDCSADVDLVVEAVAEGMAASGTVSARWTGPCRRCLTRVEGTIGVEIREIFEAEPTEGETWPITDERIDLAPAVREAVLLALPLAPLCEESCRGPEPDRFPTGAPDDRRPSGDSRWAILDGLSFDDPRRPD